MAVIEIQGLSRLQKQLRQSPQIVHQELKAAIKSSIFFIRPLMVRETPFSSGKLRRNIYTKVSGLTGEVGPNLKITPYAVFVHQGTRAHIIRPKNKKALYWKGASHPVKYVNHPGTKANKFVDRTARKSQRGIQGIFDKSIDQIIKIIAK